MSQPGETDGMTMSQHVEAILAHAKQPRLLDAVIANETLPEPIVSHYAQYGGTPVTVDTDVLQAMGLQVITSDLAQADCSTNTARHDSLKVAQTLIAWFQKRVAKAGVNSHLVLTPEDESVFFSSPLQAVAPDVAVNTGACGVSQPTAVPRMPTGSTVLNEQTMDSNTSSITG
jgi:hypothetical protein